VPQKKQVIRFFQLDVKEGRLSISVLFEEP